MKPKTLQELEELKKPHLKEIAKIDKQIEKLQTKRKHENAKVWYHERASLASMYDGSGNVFGLTCKDCGKYDFVRAGDDLYQFCYKKAN